MTQCTYQAQDVNLLPTTGSEDNSSRPKLPEETQWNVFCLQIFYIIHYVLVFCCKSGI